MTLSRAAFLTAVPVLVAASGAVAQTTALRVGAVPAESFAESYYAQDMGFFTKAGLHVDLTTMNLGPQLIPAVTSGTLDIGVSSVISLANATIHGLPFVYLAGAGMYTSSAPTIVLCVARDSTIQSPKEFEGKTVAIATIKDITHLAFVAYLTQNGVDVSKVNFIELGFSEVAPVLQRGTVVAGIISEPVLTAVSDQVRVFAKAFDAIGSRYLIGGWFARSDWYQKNKALAKRFVSVIYETAKWANKDHADSGKILQRYSRISDATLQRMTRVTYSESLTPAMLASTLSLAYRFGFISRAVTPAEMIAS